MRKRTAKNNSWENLTGFRYAHRGLFHQPRSASVKLPHVPKKPGRERPEVHTPLWQEDVVAWQREGRSLLPENSMAAFRRAVACGFGAELDVHLTRDQKLVVFHDDTLLRMCGDDRRVEACTLEELFRVKLLGTEHGIPELWQVLQLYTSKEARTRRRDVRGKEASARKKDAQDSPAGDHAPYLQLPLIIELKCVKNAPALCSAVMEELDRFPDLNYCVESFDPRAIWWLKRHRPDVLRGQLTENFMKSREAVRRWGHVMTLGMWSVVPNLLTRPDFISCKFRDRNNVIIRLCHRLGVRQVSWTIKNQRELAQVDREGGIGIFERFLPDNAQN